MTTLAPPIAHGRTADIHPWKDGWVLKVYQAWFPREHIAYEARIGRAVHAAGIPAPKVGEILEIEGKYALEYEYIPGDSMWALLEKHPLRLRHYAHQLAALQAHMHNRQVTIDIPRLSEKLRQRISASDILSDAIKQAALTMLESLPEGRALCHGDFHPSNILVSAQGATIVDWVDSSIGNPLADVARTSILALGAAATDPTWMGRLRIWLMHAFYLRRYFQLRPGGREAYQKWLPIMAAARTTEGIDSLNPWLVRQTQVLIKK